MLSKNPDKYFQTSIEIGYIINLITSKSSFYNEIHNKKKQQNSGKNSSGLEKKHAQIKKNKLRKKKYQGTS